MQKVFFTKNGHKVLVHEMNGKGSFPIKGTVMRKAPKDHLVLKYNIWKSNGRNNPIGESGWDLIMEQGSPDV